MHVMHVLLMFFAFFKNLKTSISEDNMPVHVLDVFIEIHRYYLCLKFVMLSRLFIAALWSPAGIALTACFCLKI